MAIEMALKRFSCSADIDHTRQTRCSISDSLFTSPSPGHRSMEERSIPSSFDLAAIEQTRADVLCQTSFSLLHLSVFGACLSGPVISGPLCGQQKLQSRTASIPTTSKNARDSSWPVRGTFPKLPCLSAALLVYFFFYRHCPGWRHIAAALVDCKTTNKNQ